MHISSLLSALTFFQSKYNSEPQVANGELKKIEFVPVVVVCGVDIARSVASGSDSPFNASDHKNVLPDVDINDYQSAAFSTQCFAAVEQLLPGRYRKHNFNFFMPLLTLGSEDSTSTVFSQYSYEVSGRSCIICDIQGVETPDRFIFTDPAILTLRNAKNANITARGNKLLPVYDETGVEVEGAAKKVPEFASAPDMRPMHELMTNVGDSNGFSEFLNNFKTSEAARKLGLKQDAFSRSVDLPILVEVEHPADASDPISTLKTQDAKYKVRWISPKTNQIACSAAELSIARGQSARGQSDEEPLMIQNVSIDPDTGLSFVTLNSGHVFLNPKVLNDPAVPLFVDGSVAFDQEEKQFNTHREMCCNHIDQPTRRAEYELALVEHLKAPFCVFTGLKGPQ